jgi:hypothetical protein
VSILVSFILVLLNAPLWDLIRAHNCQCTVKNILRNLCRNQT